MLLGDRLNTSPFTMYEGSLGLGVCSVTDVPAVSSPLDREHDAVAVRPRCSMASRATISLR